jgi:hypothetical protein
MKALRVPRLFTGLSTLLAAGSAFTLAALMLAGPIAAGAHAALPVNGTFSVNFTATPAAPGTFSVVANGIGSTSHAGNLLFTLQKTINFNDGTMQGTFTMTDENGDTFSGNYAGVISPPNAKGFAPFSGLLTITAGTGRFQNVKGTVSFTALANLGTGQAVYSLQGGMSLARSGGQ